MSERTLRERPEVIRGHRYIRIKSGRLIGFWDAVRELEAAHTGLYRGFSRAFKLADEYGLEVLEHRIERVEEHMAALRGYLDKCRGDQTKRERIAALRNTKGRTPEEAAAFRRKADQLEAAL